MCLYRRASLLLISLLWMLLPAKTLAQPLFPAQAGDKVRYTAYIEMPKAYISGLCIMANDGQDVNGCLFNEFGLSSIAFSYSLAKDKVTLHEVIPMLDKWYIRRVLRKDLRQLIHCLQQGGTQYQNKRRKITYTLTPLVADGEHDKSNIRNAHADH